MRIGDEVSHDTADISVLDTLSCIFSAIKERKREGEHERLRNLIDSSHLLSSLGLYVEYVSASDPRVAPSLCAVIGDMASIQPLSFAPHVSQFCSALLLPALSTGVDTASSVNASWACAEYIFHTTDPASLALFLSGLLPALTPVDSHPLFSPQVLQGADNVLCLLFALFVSCNESVVKEEHLPIVASLVQVAPTLFSKFPATSFSDISLNIVRVAERSEGRSFSVPGSLAVYHSFLREMEGTESVSEHIRQLDDIMSASNPNYVPYGSQ